jgi:hypothetical protein
MSQSNTQLRAHVREVSRQAEVVGALAREFEREPRIEVLVALKDKVAALGAAWAEVEAILTGKPNT